MELLPVNTWAPRSHCQRRRLCSAPANNRICCLGSSHTPSAFKKCSGSPPRRAWVACRGEATAAVTGTSLIQGTRESGDYGTPAVPQLRPMGEAHLWSQLRGEAREQASPTHRPDVLDAKLRVWHPRCKVQGVASSMQSSGCGILDAKLRVWHPRCKAQGVASSMQSSGCGILDAKLRVWHPRCKAQGVASSMPSSGCGILRLLARCAHSPEESRENDVHQPLWRCLHYLQRYHQWTLGAEPGPLLCSSVAGCGRRQEFVAGLHPRWR